MNYEVSISNKASRSLLSLPKREQLRAKRRIDALSEDPRPLGSIKLTGHQNLFRVRFGNYRIIYSIDDDVLIVLVIHVAHRRESYREF